MDNTKNIYQRMSAITNELTTVAKNLNINIGKGSYKAVGEADVLAAVKPLEVKHGVYSYPCLRRIVESGMLETTDSYGKDKKQLWERIETVYRFVNIDKPDEFIEITTYGDGIDNSDKSVGKAMTYADKYALLKAYKIITGDDPDQNPSEDLKGAMILPPKPTPATLEEAAKVGINLQALATYRSKKSVDELSDQDVASAIEMKKKAKAQQHD
jgi:hypothetical protein